MTVAAAAVFGISGALAGIPVAAVSYGVSASGPVRFPARWWAGSPAHPAAVATTSLLTGLAAAATGLVLPISAALPAFWVFAVIGVGLAIIDFRQRRLPHLLTGSLLVVSLASFAAAVITGADAGILVRAGGTGICTAVLLLVVGLALPGQLGLGDIAFAGAVTFTLGWLGWQVAVAGLIAGFAVQAVTVLLIQRHRINRLFPLGPALFAGWLIALAFTAAWP